MKIVIIGAGAMGGAIAEGLAGATDILLANRSAEPLERFADMGLETTTDLAAAAAKADYLILAVKPYAVAQVLEQIQPSLQADVPVAVVAAGITVEQLKSMTPNPALIVIPNTAAAVCHSLTVFTPATDDRHAIDATFAIFGRVGNVREMPENLLGPATVLASCGIAYALRYLRAATEAGVQLGFKASDAQEIVALTIEGAAALCSNPDRHAEAEIDRVTSPGGLTIRGLNAMEQAGFTGAVVAAHTAPLKK